MYDLILHLAVCVFLFWIVQFLFSTRTWRYEYIILHLRSPLFTYSFQKQRKRHFYVGNGVQNVLFFTITWDKCSAQGTINNVLIILKYYIYVCRCKCRALILEGGFEFMKYAISSEHDYISKIYEPSFLCFLYRMCIAQYCFNPRLYKKEFVIKIICLTLYWKSWNVI
jgi:hypothetical protein